MTGKSGWLITSSPRILSRKVWARESTQTIYCSYVLGFSCYWCVVLNSSQLLSDGTDCTVICVAFYCAACCVRQYCWGVYFVELLLLYAVSLVFHESALELYKFISYCYNVFLPHWYFKVKMGRVYRLVPALASTCATIYRLFLSSLVLIALSFCSTTTCPLLTCE